MHKNSRIADHDVFKASCSNEVCNPFNARNVNGPDIGFLAQFTLRANHELGLISGPH